MAEAFAKHYAQALYLSAVHNPVRLEQLRTEFEDFVDQICKEYPEMADYFDSRLVDHDQEKKFLQVLAENLNLTEEFHGFLLAVVKRNRFHYLRDIRRAFREILDASRRVDHAMIYSARTLSEAEAEEVKKRLEKVSGKSLEVRMKVDPKLLGGIRAEIGHTIYDDSLAERLKAMEEKLVSY